MLGNVQITGLVARAQAMPPLHFLQKKQVGIQPFQFIGNADQVYLAVKRTHAFVDVERGHSQRLDHGFGPGT